MDKKIAEIRARCEVATPGEWERANKSVRVAGSDNTTAPNGYSGGICNCLGGGYGSSKHAAVNIQAEKNADFIAHAREDIPALLDALDEQCAENARKDAEIARLTALTGELESRLKLPMRKNDKRIAILAESRDRWKARAEALERFVQAGGKVGCLSCANSEDKSACDKCHTPSWPSNWKFDAAQHETARDCEAEGRVEAIISCYGIGLSDGIFLRELVSEAAGLEAERDVWMVTVASTMERVETLEAENKAFESVCHGDCELCTHENESVDDANSPCFEQPLRHVGEARYINCEHWEFDAARFGGEEQKCEK